MSEPSADVSLERVLQRVSSHLDGLAGEVHALEYVIGEELGSGTTHPSSGITRLQRLDFLRQALEDLAILTLAMAGQSKGRMHHATASKLRLDTTKQLLCAASDGLKQPVQKPSNGDVDLF